MKPWRSYPQQIGEEALARVVERFVQRQAPAERSALRDYFAEKQNILSRLSWAVLKAMQREERLAERGREPTQREAFVREAMARLLALLIARNPAEEADYRAWFAENETFLLGLGGGVVQDALRALKARDEAWRLLAEYVSLQSAADSDSLPRQQAVLESLRAVPAEIWPWQPLLDLIEQGARIALFRLELWQGWMLLAPLWQGAKLRIERQRESETIQIAWDVGRVVDDRSAYVRDEGTVEWKLRTSPTGDAPQAHLLAAVTPEDFRQPWPAEEPKQTRARFAQTVLTRGAMDRAGFSALSFATAPEAWRQAWWDEYRGLILGALARATQNEVVVPFDMQGTLRLDTVRANAPNTDQILPPVAAGFLRYTMLAPASRYATSELAAVAYEWFGQAYPASSQATAGSDSATTTATLVEPPRTPSLTESPPADVVFSDDLPPDEWTPKARTEANVAAILLLIQILASGASVGPVERVTLARFSGWGGLSIAAVSERLPADWLPHKRALIHEFYTPTVVARTVAQLVKPLLPELTDEGGHVHALEPSAGIGRFVNTLAGSGFEVIRWTAVEYSHVSAQLLKALRPDVEVLEGPFEQWVTEREDDWDGKLSLVVSNPPYGVRGSSLTIDKNMNYRERRRAYAYFLRRALDLLRPNGLGVFLIPYGFLSGQGNEHRALREKVLRRHHLACAFRLPSGIFPGALLVTDLIFFRARGGELSAVLAQDEYILDGRYFAEFPQNILGREVGEKATDPGEQEIAEGPKARWGYQVEGEFDPYRLVAQFREREHCRDCTLLPTARKPARKKAAAEDVPEEIAAAIQLAERVSAYFTAIAKGDAESLQRARAWHTELKPALLAWAEQPEDRRLLIYAAQKRHPELQPLLAAFVDRKLVPQLEEPPTFVPRYTGALTDAVAQATFLYQQNRTLSLLTLHSWHREQGGTMTPTDLRLALLAAEWALDYPPPGEEIAPEHVRVMPPWDYYTGDLWPRYESAQARAAQGDEIAVRQASKLLTAIAPVSFAEIDQIEPRLGWLPIEAISEFAAEFTGFPLPLERRDGLVVLAERSYEDAYRYVTEDQRIFLGYLNHDLQLFKPEKDKDADENQDDARIRYHEQVRAAFRDFLAARPALQRQITEVYNRTYRGFIPPTYSQSELPIARWSPTGPKLKGYQWAGVRRLVLNRGGLLALDPGLGKTLTICGALAVARQEGWAQRPAVICPNSVLWNWHREIKRALPDYRICVIGAERYIARQGPRKGELISGPDTREARAYKWAQFKAGLYDVVLLARSMLDRTQIRPDTLQPLLREDPAIMRMLGLQVRNEMKPRKRKTVRPIPTADSYGAQDTEAALGEMAERKQAIFEEKEQRFIAEKLELEEGGEPDPVFWEDLGIDWLAVDEVHEGFKNLWVAAPREGGVPKFLGSPQQPAKSAWQLYFRAAIVENHTGGGGIIVASATPAKNSPLEFYTVLMYVDRKVWRRLGITDPEQYIDRYLKIERRLVASTSLETEEAPCVVGFQNLGELRPIVFRVGEFRTAKEVGLKLPEPRVRRIELAMNQAQEELYAQYQEAFAALMEKAHKTPGDRNQMLGLLQKMSMVAVHPELARGDWDWSNAKTVMNPHSPKLDECVRIVLSKRDCGHILFCDNIPVHWWLRDILVEAGIPTERIGILNASAVPGSAERQRIAERFSGDPERGILPDLDVVISNVVGTTGMNLQGRTCTLVHLDYPWEPATMTQRNGRGVRQGNSQEVVEIIYLLSERSMDYPRLQIITGKLGWMSALIESMDNETSNPAAQSGLSPEELIIYLARDKEDAMAKLEVVKARRQEEARKKLRLEAWRMLRGLSVRAQDRRREKDAIKLAQLDEDMGRIRRNLESLDSDLWPYRFLIPTALEGRSMLFFSDAEGALWEGGRSAEVESAGSIIRGVEHGRLVLHDGVSGIAFRRMGQVGWEFLSIDNAKLAWQQGESDPQRWQRPWPEEADNLHQEALHVLDTLRAGGPRAYEELHLGWGLPEFRTRLWESHGVQMVAALGKGSWYAATVPAEISGRLEILSGMRVEQSAERALPFTDAGFARYLELAPASGMKWGELDGIARWWWGRSIPRNLLAKRDAPADVGSEESVGEDAAV